MRRPEKRIAQVRANLTPALKEQLEMFVQESNVISMSDYLFELIEEHVELKSIRVSKQKISSRMGKN